MSVLFFFKWAKNDRATNGNVEEKAEMGGRQGTVKKACVSVF